MENGLIGDCMNCEKEMSVHQLHWINDRYGFKYKRVCQDCYESVEADILGNDYGEEMSYSELYGEDDY